MSNVTLAGARARFRLIAAAIAEPTDAGAIRTGFAEPRPHVDSADDLIARADSELIAAGSHCDRQARTTRTGAFPKLHGRADRLRHMPAHPRPARTRARGALGRRDPLADRRGDGPRGRSARKPGHWRSPALLTSHPVFARPPVGPSSHDPNDEHSEDRLAVNPGRLPLTARVTRGSAVGIAERCCTRASRQTTGQRVHATRRPDAKRRRTACAVLPRSTALRIGARVQRDHAGLRRPQPDAIVLDLKLLVATPRQPSTHVDVVDGEDHRQRTLPGEVAQAPSRGGP